MSSCRLPACVPLFAVVVAALACALAVSSPASAAEMDLLTDANVRLDGAVAGDFAGTPVARAGDVNGDGRDDVILGASRADNNGRVVSGSAYVVYGAASPAGVDLAELGTAGFRIDGPTEGDYLGSAVAGAGDVNGDGFDDVIVGGFGAPSAYVVFGSAAPGDVDLASLGSAGFRIYSPPVPDDGAGRSVAGAGDVDGDGFDDVVVGAPYTGDNDKTGAAYVVFGSASPTDVDLTSLGSAGFRMDGAAAGDQAGASVSGAGDVDADGFDDVIVGAIQADNNGRSESGSAYVVFGSASPPGVVDLATLGSAGFRIDGAAGTDFAGGSVAGAGDVNGDSSDDVVVGAAGADSAYVVFGSSSRTSVDLASLGSAGFRIDGAAAGDQVGYSVSGAGDVDADGFDDVIVGAWGADNNAREDSGSAYVVFGSASPAAVVDLASLGSAGFRIDGAAAGDEAGDSVSGAGDVNGDGRDDVIVGAYAASNNDRIASGSAHVVLGEPDSDGEAIGDGDGDGATDDNDGAPNDDAAPLGPPPPSLPAPMPPAPGPALTWQLERRATAKLVRRGGSLRLRTGFVAICPQGVTACTGRVTLKTLVRSRGKKGRKKVAVFLTGKLAPRTIAGGTEQAIVLRLNRRARRMLARGGSLKAMLRGSIRTGGGEAIVRTARLRIAPPKRT